MNIVVVDDEAAALSTFLYNVADSDKVCCSMFWNKPLQALDLAKTKTLAAAFLDIVMPTIDGIDLAEKLIAVNPDIKIVIISSYASGREEEIKKRLGTAFLGFCNKPYDKELLFRYIGEIETHVSKKREIEIRTFDCFDVFVSGIPITFQNAKSKELLALLVDRNGAYLTMDEAATLLWPDKNPERSRAQYRDVTYRLRMILRENNLLSLVSIERGKLRLNKENIQCDLWNCLNGKIRFHGLYMPSYDWAAERQGILETKK